VTFAREKIDGMGFRFLPEQEVHSIPFKECDVDLIQLWTAQVSGLPHTSDALTVIDTVTNLGNSQNQV